MGPFSEQNQWIDTIRRSLTKGLKTVINKHFKIISPFRKDPLVFSACSVPIGKSSDMKINNNKPIFESTRQDVSRPPKVTYLYKQSDNVELTFWWPKHTLSYVRTSTAVQRTRIQFGLSLSSKSEPLDRAIKLVKETTQENRKLPRKLSSLCNNAGSADRARYGLASTFRIRCGTIIIDRPAFV